MFLLYYAVKFIYILLNKNDARPITAELVKSEIPPKHIPNFYV